MTRGLGWASDLEHCEEGGTLADADPDAVSEGAQGRGRDQLGTLGSGNHFLEVQEVEEIYDADAGTRARPRAGARHGDDPLRLARSRPPGVHRLTCATCRASSPAGASQLPDRQLACAPLRSPEAQRYLGAMRAAANFAWANRQCIAHGVRRAFETVLRRSAESLGLSLVYDVAHNIAKFETHETVGGQAVRCLVHRKGATRAFPAGHPDVPAAYRAIGQPVLVPGDMGRYSYVLIGSPGAMRHAFGSTCHGAGPADEPHPGGARDARPRPGRRAASEAGVTVRYEGRDTLREETSEAYKDVAARRARGARAPISRSRWPGSSRSWW